MSYLSTISRLSKPNMGGLVVLQVARVADIVNIPAPVGGVIYGEVEFYAGKGFYPWYSSDQSMGVTSDDRDSQEGSYKDNQLPFFIAKDRPEIKAQLDQAQSDVFVVLYKDANGKIKLFGTKEQPVTLKYSYATDKARSGSNGYACLFEYSGPDNINFYEADIPTAPIGAAPVVIQYNGVTQLTANAGDIVNITAEFEITGFEININVS